MSLPTPPPSAGSVYGPGSGLYSTPGQVVAHGTSGPAGNSMDLDPSPVAPDMTGAINRLLPRQDFYPRYIVPMVLHMLDAAANASAVYDFTAQNSFISNTALFAQTMMAGTDFDGTPVNRPFIDVEIVLRPNNNANFLLYICVAPGLAAAPTTGHYGTVAMRPGALRLAGGSGRGSTGTMGPMAPTVITGRLHFPHQASPLLRPEMIPALAPKIYYHLVVDGSAPHADIFLKFNIECTGQGYGVWA